MGTLSGSPLNKGKTCTWSVPQGSDGELEVGFTCEPGLGRERDAMDGAEDIGGARADGRCGRLPRRCISLETSFGS